MCGMYGAHDAISAPLTKKTVETAMRALRRSAGGAMRSPAPTASAY